MENEEIVLAEHPSGKPTKSTFGLNDIDMPKAKDNEVLLKSLYVSVDPGMRGFMDKGDDDAAGTKFELNKPITSRTVAQVIESENDDFPKGTIVHGRFPWQKYFCQNPDAMEKVDPEIAPISTAVSILGIPGLAAYFGILKVGAPKKGETVLVSGAAGAVGSIASQVAKLQGCQVVGIAGSDKKIDYLKKDLGLDAGINYKKTEDMEKAIKKACPNGVDVFFDNVGGEIFDSALTNANRHSRMVICGQIADYNSEDKPQGPRSLEALIKKSAKIEGFVVYDYQEEFETVKKQLGDWLNNKELHYKENLIEGFENIPSAFIGLFEGENIGKQMVKVSDEE
ncbi:NADP-dependent oxidoreductase [Mesonia ostreae]|uniref:NADP-dependent oxidoreductase n=1 Tax=Mesonia ostreae TaxID=861110 RepID=A0ABU2KMD9_9FLAO|nr:NADP-dependent oxidoreductase [Mesonia ostreae]MDT0295891.1 NADP-dependent oxidoreductase [Mesonia ostreae]